MKPKEFDGLLRQKFEQNDFEYNPRNWDRLEEQLDGRAKKRSIALWLWMPLATGIAASVALAIGFSSMWHGETGNEGVAEFAQTYKTEPARGDVQGAIQNQANTVVYYSKTEHQSGNKALKPAKAVTEDDDFGISLQNAIGYSHAKKEVTIDLLAHTDDPTVKNAEKKKVIVETEGYNTFKPEEEKKAPKLSIILSGGFNEGNQNSGFVAGATIRKMVNDKVYIESDVAFVSSNNTQSTLVPGPVTYMSGGAAARSSAAARTTSVESSKTTTTAIQSQPISQSETYNLSYAQISPSVGYKIMKRLSLGVGPDFQQALADNRPVASSVDRNNIAEAPLFDVGFIGKTEYSVTRRMKAEISYRKGINNLLTPMDKYIDRNYMQVQLRYSVFNK